MARDDETREGPASDSHPAAEARDDEPRLPGLLLTPTGDDTDEEVDLTEEPEESLWQRPWFRATLVGVGVVVLGVGALLVPSLIGGGSSPTGPAAGAPAAVAASGSGGQATDAPQVATTARDAAAAAPSPAVASTSPAPTSARPSAQGSARPASGPASSGGPAIDSPAAALPPPSRASLATPGDGVRARAEAPPATLPARPARAEKVAARVVSSRPGRAGTLSAGRFWVQVGAFKDRQRADRLITQLARKGHTAVVVEGASADAPHAVRVGGYPTRQRARAVQTALKHEGLEGFLVESAGS